MKTAQGLTDPHLFSPAPGKGRAEGGEYFKWYYEKPSSSLGGAHLENTGVKSGVSCNPCPGPGWLQPEAGPRQHLQLLLPGLWRRNECHVEGAVLSGGWRDGRTAMLGEAAVPRPRSRVMRRRPGTVYTMGMGWRWVEGQGAWVVCGDGFLARLWSGVFDEPFMEIVAAPPFLTPLLLPLSK